MKTKKEWKIKLVCKGGPWKNSSLKSLCGPITLAGWPIEFPPHDCSIFLNWDGLGYNIKTIKFDGRGLKSCWPAKSE